MLYAPEVQEWCCCHGAACCLRQDALMDLAGCWRLFATLQT